MKVESMVAVTTDRNGRAFFRGRVALTALATLLLAPAAAHAADPGGSGSVGKSPPVRLESIPGSTAKRVILTAKAAERLGIQTSKVGEQPIVRKEMVGGLVIPPLDKPPEPKQVGGGVFGGFARLPAATPTPQPAAVRAKSFAPGEAWVLVTLSQGEWDRLAKDKPARLLPLSTREKAGNGISARPSGMPPLEDTKRSMLRLYYVVPGKNHGLTLNERMRVELELSGSDEKKKVVPYDAVYYDAKGTAWVYVNTGPLTFERQRISVERVIGDQVVVSEGPPLGTPVVVVGAALLYGAEIFGK
jgi:hypothetical protein